MEYLDRPVVGFSRQPPRLSVGYGYFRKVKADLEATCTTPEVRPECPRHVSDSVAPKVTYQGHRDGWEPYFGLELPVFLGYQPSNLATRYLYEHMRVVIGSTFERPQDNLLVGITLFPLVSSASESSPFQLSAGLNKWRPYAGMALDASQIIKPVLGALGITGI